MKNFALPVLLTLLTLPIGAHIATAEMHAMDHKAEMKETNMKDMGDHAMRTNMLKPYAAEEAKTAIESGKAVLVHFNKPGCPTCAAQMPTVEGFLKQHNGVMGYQVNYTTDDTANEHFGVKTQSTLVLFKDGKEVARSAGETDPAKLNEVLSKIAD